MRREEVQPGAVVVVHAGDKIPVDGEVLGGAAAVNQAPITGESLPVFRNPGDEVYAGTLVESGSLRVRARGWGRIPPSGASSAWWRRPARCRPPSRPWPTASPGAPCPLLPPRRGRLRRHREHPAQHHRAGHRLSLRRGLATPTAVSAAIASAAGENPDQGRALSGESRGPGHRGVRQDGHPHHRGPPRDPGPGHSGRLHPGAGAGDRASGELHSQHPLASAVLRHTAERELEIPPRSTRSSWGTGCASRWTGRAWSSGASTCWMTTPSRCRP